jgi:glycerophosphoryl diester phosphodiesterase
MRRYIIATSRSVVVNYISSPEVGFLRSLVSRFRTGPTKLVFRFLGKNTIEPSTNRTYEDLLGDLASISTFASGIIVPKDYIWPVDANLYLSPYTSIVSDAHRQGLEIFASDFANDVPFAYNYSYNPVNEYISFIDNGHFSVDGVLSDFPITPSAAIDCFAHRTVNSSIGVNVTIISREGASGDYPGCTNLAYNNAILDGADVIDCPVQISQDGVPFCLGSINLIDRTTIARDFSNLTISIPELNTVNGIFPFNLSWSVIQNLTPAILNPLRESRLFRNPRMQNSGFLVSLAGFLALANSAPNITGVLIGIENAAYLAEYQGLDVVDAVLDALETAGFNNRTAKHVMIKSTYSATLMKVKERNSNYELVYHVDENIRDVTNSTIMDIMNFADSVVISKASVFPRNIGFLTGVTDVVSKLQSFNLPVYVQLFSNEFLFQAWDFFSDAYVEINSFVNGPGINGVITDFPETAAKYRRNGCLGLGNRTPIYMSPVGPGQLLELIQPQPPAVAPSPVLSEDDVVDPPLPPVVPRPRPTNDSTAAAPTPPNGAQPKLSAAVFFCSSVAAILATLLIF